MPWDALATLMSQCIYGGKIDNEFDQRLLTSFLTKLFTPKSFDPEFPLVCNVDGKVPLVGIRTEVIYIYLFTYFILIKER